MESELIGLKFTRSRRLAREAMMKACYQIDIAGVTRAEAIETATESERFAPDLLVSIREAVNTIADNIDPIDDVISACLATGWELSRVAAVDRNILRVAAYEMYYVDRMPPKVTINEAVALAKRYSTAESGRFVNGVLGALLEKSPKRLWDPSAFPDPIEPENAAEEEGMQEPAEIIQEGSEAHDALQKAGAWTVRTRPQEE